MVIKLLILLFQNLVFSHDINQNCYKPTQVIHLEWLFIFVFTLVDALKNERKYTFEQFRGLIRQLNWARRKS